MVGRKGNFIVLERWRTQNKIKKIKIVKSIKVKIATRQIGVVGIQLKSDINGKIYDV